MTLAVPFLLLYLASLVAWPWLASGLPMTGTIAPPSIIFFAAAVAGSLYALRRNLPVGMITWVPAGLAAVAILGTGFLPPDADPWIGLIFIIVAYGIVFLLMLGLAVAVATHGTHLAIAMMAFFVMAQATRFPVFEAQPELLEAAPVLTLAAALRAFVEITALMWLATRLVTAPEGDEKRWAWAIVGLTLAHGVLVSWEDALRVGEFTLAGVSSRMLWWVMLAAIPLGMVTVVTRFWNSWNRDVPAEETHGEEDSGESGPAAAPVEGEVSSVEPQRSGARRAPRKRNRR
ncbi:MAG: hypothetical protein WD533_05080 [Dehalococcoidia bacterium]